MCTSLLYVVKLVRGCIGPVVAQVFETHHIHCDEHLNGLY